MTDPAERVWAASSTSYQLLRDQDGSRPRHLRDASRKIYDGPVIVAFLG